MTTLLNDIIPCTERGTDNSTGKHFYSIIPLITKKNPNCMFMELMRLFVQDYKVSASSTNTYNPTLATTLK